MGAVKENSRAEGGFSGRVGDDRGDGLTTICHHVKSCESSVNTGIHVGQNSRSGDLIKEVETPLEETHKPFLPFRVVGVTNDVGSWDASRSFRIHARERREPAEIVIQFSAKFMAVGPHFILLVEGEVDGVAREKTLEKIVRSSLSTKLTKRNTVDMSDQIAFLDLVDVAAVLVEDRGSPATLFNGVFESSLGIAGHNDTEETTVHLAVFARIEEILQHLGAETRAGAVGILHASITKFLIDASPDKKLMKIISRFDAVRPVHGTMTVKDETEQGREVGMRGATWLAGVLDDASDDRFNERRRNTDSISPLVGQTSDDTNNVTTFVQDRGCLLYTSPSPRDRS